MRIGIICPYFGKLPIWFDLLLYSCSKNLSIDFHFYTDCSIPKIVYENTYFHNIAFGDYCEMVSNRLGICFAPNSPYKLCDLKPFYGIIHSELVSQYDYWGFADIDLVYGDLSPLLDKVKSQRYNLITTHADRIAGHFTLIKTESEYTHKCIDIRNWQERLCDQYVYGLDEHDLTLIIYPLQKQIWRAYRFVGRRVGFIYYNFFRLFNVFTNFFSRHHFQEYYTSILPKDGEEYQYDISKGSVIDSYGRSLPYLHFLFFKKTQHYAAEKYWKEDFWMLRDMDIFNAHSGKIIFTNEKVEFRAE